MLKNKDGLEVIAQAGDGMQAIDLAKELNPEVILMDVPARVGRHTGHGSNQPGPAGHLHYRP